MLHSIQRYMNLENVHRSQRAQKPAGLGGLGKKKVGHLPGSREKALLDVGEQLETGKK